MKTNAARLHEFTGPSALRLDSLDLTAPGKHDVLVEVLHSPVHPADLNVLEGKYGKLPELPAIPGTEGCGVVRTVGSGVTRAAPGDVVALLSPGNWCNARIVHESDVFRIPASLPRPLAAMLLVNPLTAWAMLHLLGKLPVGSTVIQNAANSAVGRCVILMAPMLGLRTLNLVRRPELVDELLALGADHVFANEEALTAHVETLPEASRPTLALNAVGGTSALTMANALTNHGTLVTYGAMGRQPVKIPNGMLIFHDLRFRGFWLRHWLAENSISTRDEALSRIADWMLSGRIQIPVAQEFPLGEIQAACAAAASGERPGKIMLRCS